MSSSCRNLVMVLALLLTAGCAKQTDTVEVSGDVTWEGSPLSSGSIRFLPVDRRIAPAGSKIVDGSYQLRIKPGKMRVEIEATRPTEKIDPVEKAHLDEMFIPARYNRSSELTVDITRQGNNRFDFALSAAASREEP